MADLDLLALDDSDSEEESAPQEQQGNLTPFGTLPGVVFKPKATFQRMRDAERGHWWVVAVLGIAALILLTAVQIPVQQSAVGQFSGQTGGTAGGPPGGGGPGVAVQTGGNGSNTTTNAAQTGGSTTTIIAVVGIVAGVIGLFIGYLAHAGLLFLIGLMLGGQATFKQVFRMAVWTLLPAVIRNFVAAIAMLASGGLPAPGLSAAMTAAEAASARVGAALLQTFDVYRLWTLLLIGIGVVATQRLSRGKSVLAVVIYWVVTLALTAVVAIVGQMIAGTFAPGG